MSDIFDNIVQLVIDTNEGGYFHRKMLDDGRVHDPDGLMSAGPGRKDSGETMFGLDRVNGAKLFDNAAGKRFWKIIDDAGARDKWKWLYRGGSLEPELRKLAGQIMYPEYIRLFGKYLSPAAQKFVNDDPVLMYHFIYATWNGSGFFQKFASIFNKAVADGVKGKSQLRKVAIESRTKSDNKLIRQGGEKIKENQDAIEAKAFGSNYKKSNEKNSSMSIFTILFLLLAGFAVWYFFFRG